MKITNDNDQKESLQAQIAERDGKKLTDKQARLSAMFWSFFGLVSWQPRSGKSTRDEENTGH